MTPPGGRRGNGLTQTAPAPSRRLIPSSNNHQSASTATPPWVQFVRSVEPNLRRDLTHGRASVLMMDRRFCERVERAFKNGGEHRESAAMNGANASRPR